MAPGGTAVFRAFPEHSLIDSSEIRMALGPHHALLLSWRDEPDARTIARGDDRVAAQLNRATIAQADEQWFHHPSRRATTLDPRDLSDTHTCRRVVPMLASYSSS